MASEAAEAGLISPMTQPTMRRCHMQNFILLALKMWIYIYIGPLILSCCLRAIDSETIRPRRLRIGMWPLLIVGRVIVDMRPASAASEAIEPEVSLKVWDVLHGTL